jgi:2-dehydro-3-deoxyphosphooctonate aldolase (KDO 8-P synthase)
MKIIAGPCQHESLEQSLEIANHCFDICKKYDVEYIFKASFDKANRTSSNGKRGLGLHPTFIDFIDMKTEIKDLKILTDFHTVEQIRETNNYPGLIDVIQIPAFLCRQTDLIRAAVETGKIVNIKKGQFLAPWDVQGILSKTEGATEVWITERGTSFGYNTLVVDYTGLQYMLDNFSVPIVFDVTHSVQKPGGNGNSSGGNRSYVPGLARAGSALGISSFFLELHGDPDNAPSDGPNMLKLYDFEQVVEDIVNFNYDKNRRQ